MKETQNTTDRQSEPIAVFVSDCHFHLEPDADELVRLTQFISLLDHACRADHLILLGDIFDFWFDYPHFRHKGFEDLLQGLDRVYRAGTKIHFIGGNHDIWAADYFHRRFGCDPNAEAKLLHLGSRKVWLDHGDGLLKFDWAYNGFRAAVRTRLGIFLAKSLHPEILFALSTWLSGRSRAATRDESSRLEELAQHWFQKQQSPSWDLMIMGHIHHSFQLEREGRHLAALAGWFDELSYGLLQAGQFQLYDFKRDVPPELPARVPED